MEPTAPPPAAPVAYRLSVCSPWAHSPSACSHHCPQPPRLLTFRADDTGSEARSRVPAVQAAAVVLAVAQGQLMASALHTTQHHFCHVAGIPVPRLLGWGRRPGRTPCMLQYPQPVHPHTHSDPISRHGSATSHRPVAVREARGPPHRTAPHRTYRHRVQGVAQAQLATDHHRLLGGPAVAAHSAPLTAALHLHAALELCPPPGQADLREALGPSAPHTAPHHPAPPSPLHPRPRRAVVLLFRLPGRAGSGTYL